MPIYMNWGGDGKPPSKPKIKGAATDDDHQDWIELNSFQWGGPRTQVSNDSDREGTTIYPIIVTKKRDNTTNLFFREWSSGQPQTVTIDIIRGKAVIAMQFTDTLISSFSLTDRSEETLILNFTKIEWGNTPGLMPHNDTPPPIPTGWEVTTNSNF